MNLVFRSECLCVGIICDWVGVQILKIDEVGELFEEARETLISCVFT